MLVRLTTALAICGSMIANAAAAESSEKHAFEVNVIVEGLDHPWGLAFLPDGGLLVTERPGRLRLVICRVRPKVEILTGKARQIAKPGLSHIF